MKPYFFVRFHEPFETCALVNQGYEVTSRFSPDRQSMIGIVSMNAVANAGGKKSSEEHGDIDGKDKDNCDEGDEGSAGTDPDRSRRQQATRLIEDLPEEGYLATSLVRPVTEAEWTRKMKAQMNNKPSKLEWKDCRLSKQNGGGEKLQRGARPPLVTVKDSWSFYPLYHSNFRFIVYT